MSLEVSRIRSSFDRAARSYDRAAGLQRRVADTLMQGLPQLAPRVVVDAGCGTGYGTAALAAAYPEAQVYGFDIATAMLRATRERSARPALLCADINALPLAGGGVDLFWSSLMLQWCDHLETAFEDVFRSLAPGGQFAFSTFGPATLNELRASFNDRRTHVSRFFGAAHLAGFLEHAGFDAVHTRTVREVLYYADALSLMRELKDIGAHNASSDRPRGLTGKRAWQAMLDRYETRRNEQGLPATYEIIYVSAQRPA